jgi:CspA family cold shock protein
MQWQPVGTIKETEMSESGTVKFFNFDRGFGFITPDTSGKDIFVHARAIEASGLGDGLDEGDRVTFDTDKDREGRPMAVRLSRVGR